MLVHILDISDAIVFTNERMSYHGMENAIFSVISRVMPFALLGATSFGNSKG